jgi:hypothetical protein
MSECKRCAVGQVLWDVFQAELISLRRTRVSVTRMANDYFWHVHSCLECQNGWKKDVVEEKREAVDG